MVRAVLFRLLTASKVSLSGLLFLSLDHQTTSAINLPAMPPAFQAVILVFGKGYDGAGKLEPDYANLRYILLIGRSMGAAMGALHTP